MRIIHTILIAIALTASLFAAARADEASQSRAYQEARRHHTISTVPPLVARSRGGNSGKVVEWAGTLEGVTPVAGGLFVTLRMHGGDTVLVRLPASLKWHPGKPVYILGRIVEKNGVLHHLDGLAIAPSQQVTVANANAMQRAANAAVPIALRGNGAEGTRTLSLNGAIAWINSFNRGLDAVTVQTLARSILTSCAAYGVDTRLALSLFAAESAFHHDAVSTAGAQGLGQLMPETAATLGVHNSMNPFENADASIRHLGELMAHWRGSPTQVELALAAYNAGIGAVEQYGGIPPYPETINYIRTILSYYTELARYP